MMIYTNLFVSRRVITGKWLYKIQVSMGLSCGIHSDADENAYLSQAGSSLSHFKIFLNLSPL